MSTDDNLFSSRPNSSPPRPLTNSRSDTPFSNRPTTLHPDRRVHVTISDDASPIRWSRTARRAGRAVGADGRGALARSGAPTDRTPPHGRPCAHFDARCAVESLPPPHFSPPHDSLSQARGNDYEAAAFAPARALSSLSLPSPSPSSAPDFEAHLDVSPRWRSDSRLHLRLLRSGLVGRQHGAGVDGLDVEPRRGRRARAAARRHRRARPSPGRQAREEVAPAAHGHAPLRGPSVAVARHGGVHLSSERRRAVDRPLSSSSPLYSSVAPRAEGCRVSTAAFLSSATGLAPTTDSGERTP